MLELLGELFYRRPCQVPADGRCATPRSNVADDAARSSYQQHIPEDSSLRLAILTGCSHAKPESSGPDRQIHVLSVHVTKTDSLLLRK